MPISTNPALQWQRGSAWGGGGEGQPAHSPWARGAAAGAQVREAQVEKAGEAWMEKGDRCDEGKGIRKLASDFTEDGEKEAILRESSDVLQIELLSILYNQTLVTINFKRLC